MIVKVQLERTFITDDVQQVCQRTDNKKKSLLEVKTGRGLPEKLSKTRIISE